MSLMLKLLAITLVLSSLLRAEPTGKDVESFLKKMFAANQNIKSQHQQQESARII